MTHYAYVGVPQWSQVEGRGLLGGLFCQEIGSPEWRHLTTGLPDKVKVRTIAIHPDDPQVVYVGTQHGPYRSTDGGDHWERLAFPEPNVVVWSIIFHPQNPCILYLGAAPAAVYRSDNGGEQWRRLPIVETAGMVRMAFPTRAIRLAIDPSHPDDIYTALEVGGIIRSGDGGESWSDCSPGLLRLAERDHLRSQLGSDTEMEGMLDAHAVVVSTAQPGLVFLANRMGLFCSPDRGESWQEMEIWRYSPFAYGRDLQVAPHDTATWLRRSVRFLRYWHPHLRQRGLMPYQRRAPQPFLNGLQFLKTVQLQHAFNKRGRSGPTRGIHLKPSKGGITKETRDADVSDGNTTEDETLGWNLRLQIIEHLWHIFLESLLYHHLVRLFSPDCRFDCNLVKESPDEHLTHP